MRKPVPTSMHMKLVATFNNPLSPFPMYNETCHIPSLPSLRTHTQPPPPVRRRRDRGCCSVEVLTLDMNAGRVQDQPLVCLIDLGVPEMMVWGAKA